MSTARDPLTGRLLPGASGNPGGVSKRLQRVRKKLQKLDAEALETLRKLFASEDSMLRLEALKFWGKYSLPVPKETEAERDARASTPALSPELRAKLAAAREH